MDGAARRIACSACAAVTLAVLVGVPGPIGSTEPAPAIDPAVRLPAPLDRVRRGMTATEVRQLLGAPKRVTRQIVFRRHIEQWLYDQPAPCRVELLCERGEEGIVRGLRPRADSPGRP
jgi:hypothetical protein